MVEIFNSNGDKFYNKCWMEKDPGFLTLVADYMHNWAGPTMIQHTTMLLFFILPWVLLRGQNSRQYLKTKMALLCFMHQVCWVTCGDPGFYAVFRQHRPCRIDGTDLSHQVGSIYGFPSGDSMMGAFIGMLIFSFTPYFPRFLCKLVGVLIIVLVWMERLVMGYHSVAQVFTGAAIGIFVHYYSRKAPLWTYFLNSILLVGIGLIAQETDDALFHYPKGDGLNIRGWFFGGVSHVVFTCILLIRHTIIHIPKGERAKFLCSSVGKAHSNQSLSDLELPLVVNKELSDDSEEDDSKWKSISEKSDMKGMVFAFLVGSVFVFVSNWVIQEAGFQ
eukprot:TRINITY_DN10129_c0_g1_i1.p1 TRINITY_DN10129_c0_g1~~TRINITY_DN10129_c0_g1_i1.p1  ORF type:complete len:332 (+),score=73.22 TRINITY_DN10129_c0_g1_i1:88-1083(+)